MKKIAAFYCIFLSVSVAGYWGLYFATGTILGVKPFEVGLSLHITAEFVTAIFLLIGGVALTKNHAWAPPVMFFALGMLAYALINAPGLYLHGGRALPGFLLFWFVATMAISLAAFANSQTFETEKATCASKSLFRAIAAIYALAVGVSLAGTWGAYFATGSVMGAAPQATGLGFHIVAEFLAAAGLAAAGAGLLQKRAWGAPVLFHALGMLAYAQLNGIGLYLGKSALLPAVMAASLAITAIMTATAIAKRSELSA